MLCLFLMASFNSIKYSSCQFSGRVLFLKSPLFCIVLNIAPEARSTLEASEDNPGLTKRLIEAGKIMGIHVLNHIIISDRKYTNLKREGLF
ncbi:MAG: hypothetical protein GH155_01330 [Spirochaeta sp.]|nr:hypothetical protein [Spirochaeta sp.]